MTRTFAPKSFVFGLVAAGLLTAPALADDRPGPDWMPIEGAVRALEQAGYSGIRGLEADDGVWEGKAVKDGRSVKVKVDPQSGAVTEKAAKASKASDKRDADGDDD
ncbi:PepSY domain-containing protein [Methylorubrum salsuginis]|uniref:Peptidase propeptide and YPEB domain-containing protein n=1 Tax=Methylorubrum salsuginis TaxID=414703 RepID=A0A1I3Z0V3_9HYPH|nr:PepSY domain-containing protein [Methylorubrum salsuginis]SFK37116.1 Peptidase propeptide and YPEB domain-containing protein [Methylorubrum salsuginis]